MAFGWFLKDRHTLSRNSQKKVFGAFKKVHFSFRKTAKHHRLVPCMMTTHYRAQHNIWRDQFKLWFMCSVYASERLKLLPFASIVNTALNKYRTLAFVTE